MCHEYFNGCVKFYVSVFQSDREVMLGTILALIQAHRHCQVVDREAVTQLDAKLKEERKKASEVVGACKGVFFHEVQT